jgi:hypothetical protein
MYVFKIIAISVFLLLTAVYASAQEEDESESINPPKVDTPLLEKPQVFDINGTKVIDSTVAVGADTVLRADTSAFRGRKHSATKAVWLSAVLPGLGQAYNKKYWKIPIIYAGFGGLGYALYYTSSHYNLARAAYRAAVRGNYAIYNGYTDEEDIKYFRDTYKNYLNIAALVTVVWYGLNLIDAAVDGHLYSYNMDNKLSFNFDPSFLLPNTFGVSQTCLGLTFAITIPAEKHKTIRLNF